MGATNTYLIPRFGKLGILTFIFCFSVGFIFAQNHDHASCISKQEAKCQQDVETVFNQLINNKAFNQVFYEQFNIKYSDFISWNNFEKNMFINYLSGEICYGNNTLTNVESILIELIQRTKDNYWFEKPNTSSGTEYEQVGKYVFKDIAGKKDEQNIPKTAACLNADFEMGNHTGWDASCGTVTSALGGTTNATNNCGGQHSIVTGGNDPLVGLPRVFQGGNSAMLGDYTGTGSRYARLRKTFLVDASNPSITYNYMAVLQDPGSGHANGQRPYFGATLTVVGVGEVSCARYFSYFGDGQPGWVFGNGRAYRDWTSVFVPLEAYIGQTVILEITVGDCSQSGHWGYAYVDVSCGNMEVESFCEGASTILAAPSEGIQSWTWSTGATTPQITVTQPGTYTVSVLPIGSAPECAALLTYNASIFPPVESSFTVAPPTLCVGGSVDVTNNSTIEPGSSTITGYQWNFGDGITTPMSTGTINSVPQTTGTYTQANHVYNVLGNQTISLTVESSDGCTSTSQIPVNVIEGPEAVITGSNTVCNGDPDPQITFTGSLTTGPYTFTYNINGGPDQYVTTTAPNSSVTIPVPTSPAGTYNYNLTYVLDPTTAQCEQPQTGTATIVVNPLPTATIGTDVVVCQGEPAQTITFTGTNGVPNTNYQFAYSVNGGATQTINSPAGSPTATITIPTTVADTFVYTLYTVTDLTTNCSDTVNGGANISTVIVNPMPDATISGSTVVCQNDAQPTITLTGTNSHGNYTFTYNINGGATQTVSATGTNTVVINVPTNTATTYTYELLTVTDPASGCSQNINETQVIVVNPLPTATIGTNATVCQGAPAQTITFTGANGVAGTNYQFDYSVNGTPQTINSPAGSSVATITIPTTAADTLVYVLYTVTDLTTNCSDTIISTNTSTVIINPMPDATIAGSTVVCQNDAQPVITFTGNNSHGNYTFAYSINGGTTQTITATGTTVATVNVPTNVATTYTYELISVTDPASGCSQNINETQVVTVNPLPTATIYGTITLCQHSANPQITFTGSNGVANTSYQFTYSINGGVHQTVTSSGVPSVTVNVPTSVATTYTYTLHSVVDVATGCNQSQTGSAVVTVNPTPMGSIAGNTTICQGGTAPIITFTGVNSLGNYAFSYNVNGGPTQTVTSTGTTATVTQSTAIPGTYVYELTNIMDPASLCNSDTSLLITIVVNPLPSVVVSPPVEACHLSTVLPEVTFEGTGGTAPYTFTYNINGGANQFATSTGNTFSTQVSTSTVGDFIYTVTNVQDNLGCQQNVNYPTMVTINPLPVVDAGTDLTICAGTTIVLTGSGEAQQYIWDNGVTNGVPFQPSDTTTYTVIGIDHNLCENTDQVTVNVVPIPVMNITGQDLSGCPPVIPTLHNNSTGNLTNCTWYLGNGEVIQGCGSVSSVFDSPGCFDVTLVVATPEGCSNTLTLGNYICVDDVPIADFYPDPAILTTYNWESTMVNESVGATSYVWNFGDGSQNSYEHSPTHEFPNDYGGIYTVSLIATSANGCIDTAYATVEVKEELLFWVPNTFTPDNDDYNETFKPIFTTGFDPYNYGLYIYNRWGEMIFESHDTNVGWNGKYGIDSKLCQDGTYTWKIVVKKRLVDEHLQFVGHINLIR